MDSSTSNVNQTNSPTSLPKGYSDEANVSVSLSNCRCLYWVDKNLIWTGQKHYILHTMHVDILKKNGFSRFRLGALSTSTWELLIWETWFSLVLHFPCRSTTCGLSYRFNWRNYFNFPGSLASIRILYFFSFRFSAFFSIIFKSL